MKLVQVVSQERCDQLTHEAYLRGLRHAAALASGLTPHQADLPIYDECRAHGKLIAEAIERYIADFPPTMRE